MTVSPFKRNKVLRRVRSSPKGGKEISHQDDWLSATNFVFPDSPTLSRRRVRKRPMAPASSSEDKELSCQNRRQSVLLKRLDLPAVVMSTSPTNVRRTRRQSMIHLNMKEVLQSTKYNSKRPLPAAEEESNMKILRSQLPPTKAAAPKREATKPVVTKKDISKTDLQKKKNGIVKTAPVKTVDLPQRRTRRMSEAGNSILPENRTKRRIEIEVISEVEQPAKKRRLGPSADQKLDVQTSYSRQTLQNSKSVNHSLSQKKTSDSGSLQMVKATSPSPTFGKKVSISGNFASRRKTRASTKCIVPKNFRESVTSSPPVTKTQQVRKAPATSAHEVMKSGMLAPANSSAATQIKPLKRMATSPPSVVSKTKAVTPSPKRENLARSSVKSTRKVKLMGNSPQASSMKFRSTLASSKEVHSTQNIDAGSSPMPISARMQLQIIRNSPVQPNQRRVQPFTPKPDPPPSHILKQTLKNKVDHELEKEAEVVEITEGEEDEIEDCEHSDPNTVNESCSDGNVLVPNSVTSTPILPTTPRSSRQQQASTQDRSVESSCNTGNAFCQQNFSPAIPRSSTPIEEETRLDCLTVDPIVKVTKEESETGTSPESSDTSESDDDSDDDSAEMEMSEDATPPQSKQSYCVVM
ncbi:uncharacterized protein [Panulirus ornatus]